MDRVVVNQLTVDKLTGRQVDRLTGRQVDRLTGSFVTLIYGTERLRELLCIR